MAFRMRAYRTSSLSVPFDYYYLYIANNVPTLSSHHDLNALPSHVDKNGIIQEPVFVSPNRSVAKRWEFFSPAFGLFARTMNVAYGTVEYVMMTAPNGTVYAYGLNNDGTFYLEEFENGVPTNRRTVMTIMHKGKLVWVADNRQPTPRVGDL